MEDKKLRILSNYKLWKLLLLLICLIFFIIILINVLNGNILTFDKTIYNLIISFKSNFVTNFFKGITKFGDEEILILIAVLSLILIKNRKIGGCIAVNLASVGLLNHILKEIIKRERPTIENRMVQESSFSFPSGHAMAGLAFYGLIIYFILKNIKNKKLKNTICIILSILIFLIGISRIYLGVHYSSDVIAGFLVSTIYLILYITYIVKMFKIEE